MKKHWKWILIIEVQVIFGITIFFWMKLDSQKVINRLQAKKIIELEELMYEDKLTQVSETDIVIGNEDAPVEIIMYTRFDCPICQDFFQNKYQSLKKTFFETGKAKLIIRNLVHQSKGKNLRLSTEIHQLYDSKSLSLNEKMMMIDSILMNGESLDSFEFADSKKAVEEELLENARYYRSLGIRQTPTFFINGTKILGDRSVKRFSVLIEDFL